MATRLSQRDMRVGGRLTSDDAYSGSTAREIIPFSLRCGALLIDYTVVVTVVALGTILARMFGGGARVAGSTVETLGWVSGVLLVVLNFVALPGLIGQTLGKWTTGLYIETVNGGQLSFGRAALRHFVGYTASILSLGLGFLIAAFGAKGRALHDFIAGTVVVRKRATRPIKPSRGI
jgi:uncharacterized RDD family membrane protein YckC